MENLDLFALQLLRKEISKRSTKTKKEEESNGSKDATPSKEMGQKFQRSREEGKLQG